MFSDFIECPFSLPKYDPGYLTAFGCPVTLSIVLVVTITQTLFLMILRVLRNITQVFCKTLLTRIFLMVFMIRAGLFVWGKQSTEVKCYFHLISSIHTINTIYDDLNYLAEIIFARYLYCKVIPFFLFHIILFVRKSLCEI